MPVETAADLAVFVNPDEFGAVARVVPRIGAAVTVNGIYDAAYQLMELGQAGVAGVAPVFICRAMDLAALPMRRARAGDYGQADRIEIGGVSHLITDVQPDGTGMTVLILERD